MPFFSLSGSDFVEMFVGVGAARVRSLFAQAEAKAPCLIFIDELDAIGKARGSGGPGRPRRARPDAQPAPRRDGRLRRQPRRSSCMAATNRPETLDPALVRPGRFDRQVVVDRPDLVGREQILKVHARIVPLDDEINLRQIAAMTPGFVGADLANLVNEAALLAARKGQGPRRPARVRGRGRAADRRPREAPAAAPAATRSSGSPSTRPATPWSPAASPRPTRSTRSRSSAAATARSATRMYRPEDDRFLHTRTWLENTICSLLGGTLAEEIALRRGLRRLHQRPPARHPDRPPDGHRVRHEPRPRPASATRPRAAARSSAGGGARATRAASRPPARSTSKSGGSSTRPSPRPGGSSSNAGRRSNGSPERLIERETIGAVELAEILAAEAPPALD